MNISTEKSNEKLTLRLDGRLDTTTAPALEAEINEAGDDIKDLILDFTKLEYISSAGLRVLLSAQKKFSKVGSMKLIGVNDQVMEVFEMTGFADILVIE